MLLQARTPFPSRATWAVPGNGYWIRVNTNLVLNSAWRGLGLDGRDVPEQAASLSDTNQLLQENADKASIGMATAAGPAN